MILEIQGRRVEVGDEFATMSPEEQGEAVDSIGASMGLVPATASGAKTMSGAPVGYEDGDATRSSRAYAQRFADFATIGNSDEIAAFLGSWAGQLPGGHGLSYDELLKQVRKQGEEDARQHPYMAAAGSVSGGLAGGTALVKGGLSFAGRAAESGMGWLTRLLGGGADGALLAGAHGFGSGEGLADRTQRAVDNAPLGFALGAAGEGLATAGTGLIKPFLRGADDIGEGVNAAANVQTADEFGIPLSKAQAGRSVNQANVEDQLRSSGAMSAFDQAQRDAVDRAAGNLQTRVAGETPVYQRADDAMAGVQSALRGKRDRLKAESRDAYKRSVDNPNVLVPGEAVQAMPKFIRGRLNQENIVVDPAYHAGAARALDYVDGTIARMPKPTGDVQSVQAQLQWVENLRSGLRKNFPPIGQDAPALREINRAVDDWTDAVFDAGLVSGSDDVLAELKNARAKWTEYKALIDPRSKTKGGEVTPTFEAQRRVRDIMTKEMSPEEIGRYLFGASVATPKQSSYSTARELKKHLGADSEAWSGVRQSVWLRATRAGDENLSPARIAKNLEGLLGENSLFSSVLFSSDERELMRKFGQTLKLLEPAKQGRNAGNTANRLIPVLSRYGQQIANMIGTGAGVASGMAPLSALGLSAAATGVASGANALRRASLVNAATRHPVPTKPTGRIAGAVRGVTAPAVENHNQEMERRRRAWAQ